MGENIAGFLVRAKKAIFAADRTKFETSRPNSNDIQYVEGNLKYIDTFLGGASFSGQEALWKNDIPFWSMNYIGRLLFEDFSIYKFLNEALLLVPEEYPFRGPLHYANDDYIYKCNFQGNFHWFSGVEEIFYKGDKVYELAFHGGDVK
ncbi:MAG: DUF5680 domain-containing protein [Defluviitaleaceae bacterium]|nr:DUF5680 domain-containing protein [Defluviitaleaceae bacterium]